MRFSPHAYFRMKHVLTSRLLPLLLTWLTATSPSVAAFADFLQISTAYLQLRFDPVHGQITSLEDRHTGMNLLDPAVSPGLWRLEFGENAQSISPQDAKKFDSIRMPGREPQMRFIWWDFGSTAPELQVEVLVRLDRNSALSRWQLKTTGLAGKALRRVRFPHIPGIARQKAEMLAIPAWMGQETSDPRKMIFADPNRPRRLEWAYPGGLSLQCLAWYAHEGTGLYLACEDTAAFRKTLAVFGDSQQNTGCEWVHLPEAKDPPPNEWTLPYPVLLGTFQGDWITAAERYRSWGTNQVWARESRLNRGAVPAWITDTGLWVWNRGRSDGVLDPALVLQERLHLPVSVFWHWWHGCAYDSGFPEYLPPREGADRFRDAVTRARDRNVRTLVYMNQRLWGMTTQSWLDEGAERWAVKAPGGKILPEIYNTFTKEPCAAMCMGTRFWRNKYAGLAEQTVMDLGVGGIYMDQACLSLACYDATHGHPIGGGTYWVNGFRLMAHDIRHRCERTPSSNLKPGPGLGLAGEGCGEPWMPDLDLMLSLQVSRERYAAPDGWETIPFFHAVYHPYAITFGNYSSLTMPPYDDLWPAEFAPKEPLQILHRRFSHQFLMEQARAFVWGQQPTIANFLPAHFDDRPEEVDYVLRLASLRQSATNFLIHGTFLRPPIINAPVKTVDMSRLSIYAGQHGGLTVFQKDLPLAVAGAWRAPDGKVGIALASIANEPLELQIPLNAEEYKVSRRTRVRLLDPGRETDMGRLGPKTTVNVSLPPRGACILELRRSGN